jgi:hypothetical protein
MTIMASHRDKAFQTFYDNLSDKGGIGGEDLLRKAWEAGRRYEVERIEAVVRPKVERCFQNDGLDG